MFEKSRDDWRAKAIARRTENRLLELKIRDLKISRAKWKEKALNDISHRLALLLKAEVEAEPFRQDFQQLCNQLRTRLQQTEWDFLMPPAKRTKGRFMAMERIGLASSDICEPDYS